MPAKNLANEPVTANRDTSLQELAIAMDDEEIGDVVITEDDEPVGVVTDRDIALAVAKHGNPGDLTADHLVDGDTATVHESAEAVEIPAEMADAKVRRLPVVDSDGSLTGIVTADDVVATVGEELEDVATVIESQSPGYSPD